MIVSIVGMYDAVTSNGILAIEQPADARTPRQARWKPTAHMRVMGSVLAVLHDQGIVEISAIVSRDQSRA